MADETTYTTADDLRYAAIINEAVIEELRAAVVCPKLMRTESLAGLASKAMDFPIWPTISAAGLTEATDMSNTAISTTKATITAAEVGVMTEVTDVLELSDILNGLDGYSQTLGRSLGTKLDTDITALFTGFSSSVGTSGSNITTDNFIEATYTLRNASAPQPFVCVLHPRQTADLDAALGGASGSTATVYSNVNPVDQLGVPDANGYWGTLYGVPIWETGDVATANTAADRAGAMFSKGYALGLCPKYLARTENERNASKRTTEIVVTGFYGVGELIDGAGVGIVTDA